LRNFNSHWWGFKRRSGASREKVKKRFLRKILEVYKVIAAIHRTMGRGKGLTSIGSNGRGRNRFALPNPQREGKSSLESNQWMT